MVVNIKYFMCNFPPKQNISVSQLKKLAKSYFVLYSNYSIFAYCNFEQKKLLLNE